MLQVHAFPTDDSDLPQPTQWADRSQGNRLDVETGALLRQVLTPVFSEADTWQGLLSGLQKRGFDLRFEGARLILVEAQQGQKICTCRFLGHSLKSLSDRFGKVRAHPPRDDSAFGHLSL